VLYCLGDRERRIEVIVVVFLSASNNPFVVLRISVASVAFAKKLRSVFIEGRGKTERERERERMERGIAIGARTKASIGLWTCA